MLAFQRTILFVRSICRDSSKYLGTNLASNIDWHKTILTQLSMASKGGKY
jgi:hypothetical protein